MDILEKLKLLREAERLTSGLSDNDCIRIDNKSILFEHLGTLYGTACKIRAADLIKHIEFI